MPLGNPHPSPAWHAQLRIDDLPRAAARFHFPRYLRTPLGIIPRSDSRRWYTHLSLLVRQEDTGRCWLKYGIQLGRLAIEHREVDQLMQSTYASGHAPRIFALSLSRRGTHWPDGAQTTQLPLPCGLWLPPVNPHLFRRFAGRTNSSLAPSIPPRFLHNHSRLIPLHHCDSSSEPPSFLCSCRAPLNAPRKHLIWTWSPLSSQLLVFFLVVPFLSDFALTIQIDATTSSTHD